VKKLTRDRSSSGKGVKGRNSQKAAPEVVGAMIPALMTQSPKGSLKFLSLA